MKTALSVAVIGGGPRAMMALRALDQAVAEAEAEAARAGSGSGAGTGAGLGTTNGPVQVDLFEPGQPGPGAVWDPAQPSHLLLNVEAGLLDLRSVSVPMSYPQWAAQVGEQGTGYPPRAIVGRYLAWVWQRLLASPRLAVRHHREQVLSVHAAGHQWRVSAQRGKIVVDQVVICTGHAGGVGADHGGITRGYDSENDTEHDSENAAQVVVVRGAALTAIDVALDLSAGRGGTWLADPTARSGLRYQPGGAEPTRIEWRSRSGELLIPKPEVSDDAAMSAVRAHTAALRTLGDPDERWWQVLAEAATAAARLAGVALDIEAAWTVLDHGRDAVVRHDPWVRWTEDLSRAEGRVDADPAWWWGRAWSYGYADVVAGLERAPRHRGTWTRWRSRAARLERWAFGPPAESVRRMLALHEAGLLDLRASADPVGDSALMIDAVTTGPGIVAAARSWQEEDPMPPAHSPLWQGLLDAGVVTVRPGERGVFTTPEGTCLDAAGQPSSGLCALGRPTEDPVIGHDTLSRTLHRDVDRWAAHVLTSPARHAEPWHLTPPSSSPTGSSSSPASPASPTSETLTVP